MRSEFASSLRVREHCVDHSAFAERSVFANAAFAEFRVRECSDRSEFVNAAFAEFTEFANAAFADRSEFVNAAFATIQITSCLGTDYRTEHNQCG